MKRWIAVLLILALAITGLAGCKKAETNEESAAAGEYVEGGPEQEGTGKGPVKVENQDMGGEEGNTPDTPNTPNTPETNTPETNTPETNTPETNTPEGNEPETNEPEAGETVEYDKKNVIKILDYNIRCANDPDGRSIKERSIRMREVMKKYTPDICGFQEVVPEWVTYLKADYPEYGSYIQYRSKSSSEGPMVMWNTKTMEMLETGHFWLSDTPETESKATNWGEVSFPRIVAWAKVKVLATGREFVYFSTHQEAAGTAPVNSAKTILSYAKKFGVGTKYPGFCMGDYNIKPWTPGYTGMLEGNIFGDVKDDLGLPDETTVGGYHLDTPAASHIIDFVFYTPAKVHPLHYEVVDMEIDGNYVSDHKGIYVEAALL